MPVTTREDWFDRLARTAARPRTPGSNESDGISRRDALGIFTSATAMAFLGSWARPRHALGATPHTGKDPGCGGTRTSYSEGCAKKVPKLNFTPNKNGCGPQNGFNFVPQAPLFIASFTPACDFHDVGYGTCNRPKDVTDQKFLEDMKTICAGPGTPLPGGIVDGFVMSVLMLQCIRNAEIFYAAVSTFAGDPYKEGQAEACDCCDEPKCQGGGTKCDGLCCPQNRPVCVKGFTSFRGNVIETQCCPSSCKGTQCPYDGASPCPVCCQDPGFSICCRKQHGFIGCCKG